MRTVYVDAENKCHVQNDGTMTAVNIGAFVGKCDTFVEGYCAVEKDGALTVYPWKDLALLEAAQAEYEKNQAEMADMQAALALLGVTVDE